MSAPSPAEIEYEEAHIHQQRSTVNIVVLCVFTGLALLVLFARLASRKIQRAGFALDDYLIILGMACTIVNVVAGCGESYYGYGKHVLALTPHDRITMGKYEAINLYSLATCMTFNKLSILAFLVRVFSPHSKGFKVAIWLLSGYIICWAVALFFVFSFQCRPFSRYWSLTDPCPAPLSLSYSSSVLSTAHDVALLVLPQPIIWRLHMPNSRKLGISLIFVIGFVATLMGILKIVYLNGGPQAGTHKADVTYVTSPALIFASLEPVFTVICACLPATPAFFTRVRETRAFSLLTSLLTSRSRHSTTKEPYPNGQKHSSSSWVPLEHSAPSIIKQTTIETEFHEESEEYPFDELRTRGIRPGNDLV